LQNDWYAVTPTRRKIMNVYFAEFMNELESPFFTVSEIHKIFQNSLKDVSLNGEAATLGLKIHEKIRTKVVEIITLPLHKSSKLEIEQEEQNLRMKLVSEVAQGFTESISLPADYPAKAEDLAELVVRNIFNPLLETAAEIDRTVRRLRD
jgi:hypothetical protein